MCCLFGVVDHALSLTRRQRQRLVSSLSIAAQARGTDATGLAYCSDGHLRICKGAPPGPGGPFSHPSGCRCHDGAYPHDHPGFC